MKKKEKNIMNSRLAQSEIEDTSLSSQDKTLEARIIFGISDFRYLGYLVQ